MRQPVIRTIRQHKTQHPPCQCSRLHGYEHGFRREKIRSLYIKVFPGAGYRHDKSLHDFFPRGPIGSAVTICASGAADIHLREVAGRRNQGTVYKNTSRAEKPFADHAQPYLPAAAGAYHARCPMKSRAYNVPGQVHSAYKAHAPVNDYNLAVVAVIHLCW